MSQPQIPNHVKLIASIFSVENSLIDEVMIKLTEKFGSIDWTSPELFFDRTKYYAREMGWPLHRRFISFSGLIPAEELVKVKLATNEFEKEYLDHGNRQVNIDPGYISAERLILATGKNYIHRVYLTKGIYADLTLLFKKGGFRSVEWTYPDYANPDIIDYFNEIRKTYMAQIMEKRRLD